MMRSRLYVALGFGLLCTTVAITHNLAPPLPGDEYCQSKLCHAYRYIYFDSSTSGYVSEGANVFRTTDGGATWVPAVGPASTHPARIAELFFVDGSTFFVYGDQFLGGLRT
jgi:photosystem II stability/assembly factor-like uncharacterized protein